MIFRALARRCRIAPYDARRLTFSQAVELLSDADPDDPHKGNVPIESIDDLRDALADYLDPDE